MDASSNKKLIKPTDFNSIELLLDEIIRVLKSDGILIGNAAQDYEIIDFENANSIKLSNELKRYFQKINGLEGADFISKLNPISELKKVKEYPWFSNVEFTKEELPEVDNIFIIGDIMIDSHQWGIKLNAEGKTEEIIEMDFYTIVSKSISDFLVKFINEDPYSLVTDR